VKYVFYAFIATLCTWLITAAGAASVVFFREVNKKILNIALGFSAGVMIAASFWSLLQPALELAAVQSGGVVSSFVVTAGFLCGAIFIAASDKIVTKTKALNFTEGRKRAVVLLLAITLHNIPEGLAIGVAFGALSEKFTPETFAAAVSVAIGIGLQNFPEGAAAALPLRREGCSRLKSFLLGQCSGLVEPIAGVLGAVLAVTVTSILPFALAFAAGAMILVSVHELIPECQQNKSVHPYFATTGIMVGFTAMMLLDTIFG
jgi:ZIP family zinc transporter